MRKRTLVTHPPDVQVPADNRPLVAPIYQSVKFTFDDVGATLEQFKGKRAGFYYSRVSNPTLRQLELLGQDVREQPCRHALGEVQEGIGPGEDGLRERLAQPLGLFLGGHDLVDEVVVDLAVETIGGDLLDAHAGEAEDADQEAAVLGSVVLGNLAQPRQGEPH